VYAVKSVPRETLMGFGSPLDHCARILAFGDRRNLGPSADVERRVRARIFLYFACSRIGACAYSAGNSD
jgi:hypothetical protein